TTFAGGNWYFQGGTISGGTLALSNGAQLIGTTSGGALDGVTLDGDLAIYSGGNGAAVTILAGLTLNGTVTVGGGSGVGARRFAGTQTLGGTGTVVLNSNNDSRNALAVTNANTTLTIGSGITVRGGYGTVGYQSTWSQNNVAVINQGTISADVSGR